MTSNRLDESREVPLLDFGIQSESDEPLLTFNDKLKHNEFDFGDGWDFPAQATFSQAKEKSKQADAVIAFKYQDVFIIFLMLSS